MQEEEVNYEKWINYLCWILSFYYVYWNIYCKTIHYWAFYSLNNKRTKMQLYYNYSL